MKTLDEIKAKIACLEKQLEILELQWEAMKKQRKNLITHYALGCKNCENNEQIRAGKNCPTAPFPQCFCPNDKWRRKHEI
jgi:hypothetical protein